MGQSPLQSHGLHIYFTNSSQLFHNQLTGQAQALLLINMEREDGNCKDETGKQ
jgi:hypothetical protein